MTDSTASNSAADTGASQAGAGVTQEQINDLETKIASLGVDLKSVSENINKISEALSASANFNTTVQGVDDPYENKRRDRLAYDGLLAFGMAAAQVAMENTNLIVKQHMRHSDIAHSRYWGDAPSAGAAGKPA